MAPKNARKTQNNLLRTNTDTRLEAEGRLIVLGSRAQLADLERQPTEGGMITRIFLCAMVKLNLPETIFLPAYPMWT